MMQSEKLNIDENTLLQTIDRISAQLEYFESKMQQNMHVLILVGNTGSGKSTIFNFLCGATFKYVVTDDEEYLDLDQECELYSEMNNGMKSVTKEPKYYYNETFNHLLIDFPGFHDTNGEIDQLIIQMIFYKFITKSNVKIAYVITHPSNDFIERGQALQSFINTVFKEKNLEISKLALILNSYTCNYNDEKLINHVQKKLKDLLEGKHEWISVIRQVQSQKEINQVFSNEKREKLWFELISVNQIQFQPQILPYSDKISTYITEKSNIILNQICQQMDFNLTLKQKDFNEEQFILLQSLINSIQHILLQTPDNIEDWFNKFINISLELSKTFHFQNDITQNSQNFLKIFNFFSFFSEFIYGYSTFEKHCIQVQQKCTYFLENLQKKIELQRAYEERNKEQQNRIKAEQQFTIESQIRIQKEQMYAQEYENRIKYEQQLKMEQQLRTLLEQDKQGMELQYKEYCEKSLQIQSNLQKLIETEKAEKQQVEQDLMKQLQELQGRLNEMELKKKKWLERKDNIVNHGIQWLQKAQHHHNLFKK